tara:strand:- start:5179 stop:5517 length:339 start_codon:yes stop_codon:yes gene_type:complete
MSKKPSLEELEKIGSAKGAKEKVDKDFHKYKEKNRSRIAFINELESLYDYLTSGKVSTKHKAIIIGTLIYFINPLDVVPDITPILGFADDFALVTFVFKYLAKHAQDFRTKT